MNDIDKNKNCATECCVTEPATTGSVNKTFVPLKQQTFGQYIPAVLSLVLLFGGIVLDSWIKPEFFNGYVRLGWYLVAYLPVALPVLKSVFQTIVKGEIFTEFLLMTIATVGAFAIGEYPEGVAVMLFYAIGELFQAAAVNKAKGNIKALLDIRPESATVLRNGQAETAKPETIEIAKLFGKCYLLDKKDFTVTSGVKFTEGKCMLRPEQLKKLGKQSKDIKLTGTVVNYYFAGHQYEILIKLESGKQISFYNQTPVSLKETVYLGLV